MCVSFHENVRCRRISLGCNGCSGRVVLILNKIICSNRLFTFKNIDLISIIAEATGKMKKIVIEKACNGCSSKVFPQRVLGIVKCVW